MNETIGKIKALLIEASEKQHELSQNMLSVQAEIEEARERLKQMTFLKNALAIDMGESRNKAKDLAFQYVLDGQDSTQLPRAITVRYRKSYSYDDTELVFWLHDNGHHDMLKIDTKKLNAMLKKRGTDRSPVTEVETAEIVCDTDLKWMTDNG